MLVPLSRLLQWWPATNCTLPAYAPDPSHQIPRSAAIKITFDIFFMYTSPATIYQTNGNTVSWLTYSEWLLTCPVRSPPSNHMCPELTTRSPTMSTIAHGRAA